MKKRMNDKGFSLVELIIVIAIMVVLIAVLAPQYLKYVEKSRVASDQTTVVEYIDAMQVIAADPDISLSNSGTSYTVTANPPDAKGKVTLKVSTDLKSVLNTEGVLDNTTMESSVLQSTTYKNIQSTFKLELTYDSTNKVWQVKATGVDLSGAVPTPAGP